MKKILIVLLIVSLLPLVSCKKETEENTLYNINAVFDGVDTLTAKMTVDYYNNTDTEIKALKFNLYPNAFREGAKYTPTTVANEQSAYPSGKNYGGIEITECKSEGEATGYEIAGEDDNILVLSLKKGVFPAERAVVSIDFKVKIPECRLRLGHFGGYVNLGNWYPILCVHEEGGFYECLYSSVGDPFYSEIADYTVSLTVPGEYTVSAGGICDLTEVNGNITTYTYRLDNARDCAFVLNKSYQVTAKKIGDVDVRVYTVDRDGADYILETATLAIETFSKLFGEYPYPSLSVAETEFLQGGMEYPALVYISDELTDEDFLTATVHEIAHQWWYACVGNNQTEFAFLDEGLAEYSTMLFYENNSSYGVSKEDFVKAKTSEYRAFCGVFEQLKGEVNTVMQRKLKEFSGEYEYIEISYVKSFLMFDNFRQGVGDTRFFKGLRKYFELNAYSLARPCDLISAFEKAGCDAEGYFNSWIDGKVII